VGGAAAPGKNTGGGLKGGGGAPDDLSWLWAEDEEGVDGDNEE